MSGPLGVVGFRRLWVAGVISELGDWLLHIALPLVVLQLTGSALVTATVFVLGLAPAVLAGPLAGVLADRVDRRRLLVVVSVAQAALLLTLLTVHGRHQLWLLYLVTSGESVLAAVFEPAESALVPELVGPDRLVAANGLVGLGENVGRLVGSPLGGVVLAWTGLRGVVLADAVSFLLVAALIGLRPGPPATTRAEPPETAGRVRTEQRAVGDGWTAGVRVVAGSPRLRRVFGALALMAVAQGFFLVLFLLFVRDELHSGDASTGLLRGVQAVGGVLGGLVVGVLARRSTPRLLGGWGAAGFGALTLLTWNLPAVSTALAGYAVLFALMGLPAVICQTGVLAEVQHGATDALRGRVLGCLQAVDGGCQSAGMLLAGALDGIVRLPVLLDVQAGLYLAAGVLLLVRRRADGGGAGPDLPDRPRRVRLEGG